MVKLRLKALSTGTLNKTASSYEGGVELIYLEDMYIKSPSRPALAGPVVFTPYVKHPYC